MAARAPVIFAALLLEHHDGSGSALTDDLAGHARLLNRGLSHGKTLIAMNEVDVRQFDRSTDFAGESFNLKNLPGLHPVLFSACRHDSVHIGKILQMGDRLMYHVQ